MTEEIRGEQGPEIIDPATSATDSPYKDDTSDGTTAKTPQQIAEETAGDVRSSDDMLRESEGREHPVEGHDVRDYRPIDTEAANVPENPGFEPQAAENVGDDDAVDEHGDDVDTPDDAGER